MQPFIIVLYRVDFTTYYPSLIIFKPGTYSFHICILDNGWKSKTWLSRKHRRKLLKNEFCIPHIMLIDKYGDLVDYLVSLSCLAMYFQMEREGLTLFNSQIIFLLSFILTGPSRSDVHEWTIYTTLEVKLNIFNI